jgi:hypothetical protein
MRMITDGGRVQEFLCLRPSHDPSPCEQQCKTCFDLDAEMEHAMRQKGLLKERRQ